MSRNLGRTNCYFCEDTVWLKEPPRPITKEEAGYHFRQFEGMLVANAVCHACEARYLAWVDETTKVRKSGFERERHQPKEFPPVFHVDLSFRSTFNDEPGKADIPRWDVEVRRVRVGPYSGPWKD